jgi:hypothetical protein
LSVRAAVGGRDCDSNAAQAAQATDSDCGSDAASDTDKRDAALLDTKRPTMGRNVLTFAQLNTLGNQRATNVLSLR